MAKPGAGKRKMQAQRKKQWNNTKKSLKSTKRALKKGGCYIATCVYGSYDCPEVWTLRRFRDKYLERYLIGRAFISTYYFVSPVIVKIFGKSIAVKKAWKKCLDPFVEILRRKGFKDTPYSD